MDKDSPLSIYIAYQIEYYNERDVVNWAVNYLKSEHKFSKDINLIDLAFINTKNSRELEKVDVYFNQFINDNWPDFQLSEYKSEQYAHELFKERLVKYISGKSTPYEICKMICPIEQIYDFPSWLGDMYNACDWVEPNTLAADCKHLKDEILKTLELEVEIRSA